MADAATTKTEVSTLKDLLIKQGFGKATDDQFETGEAWKAFAKKAGVKEVDINRVAIDVQAPCDSVVEDKSMDIVNAALKAVAPAVATQHSAAAFSDPTKAVQQKLAIDGGFNLGTAKDASDGVNSIEGVDGIKGSKTICGVEAVLRQFEKHKTVDAKDIAAARADLRRPGKQLSEATANLVVNNYDSLSEQAKLDARKDCVNGSCELKQEQPKAKTAHRQRGTDWYERNGTTREAHLAQYGPNRHSRDTSSSFTSHTYVERPSRPATCRELVARSNDGAAIGGVGQIVGAPGIFFPPLMVAGNVIGGIGTIETASANAEAARRGCYYMPAQATVGVGFGINIGGHHGGHRHHHGGGPKTPGGGGPGPGPTKVPDGRPGGGVTK